MKIDVRNVNIWDTIYTINKWKVHTIVVKDFLLKINLVAQPLCLLEYFDTEKEAKEIAKKQLKIQMKELDT